MHHALARSCVTAAGGTVILHGSLALGGYRPGRSDIDLLQIVPGPLRPAQVTALLAVAGAAPVDLHVLTTAVVTDPTPAPPVLLYAGHGETATDVPADPDVITELSVARAHGITLAGPPVTIGPVPRSWIEARGRHWLTRWLTLTDDAEHAAFMVLTACRMWHFAASGTHSPKLTAARWALTQDPTLSAIPLALRDPAPAIPPAEITRVLTAALTRS